MIEELFHIGDFAISPFGPMLVLALFAAFWQLRRSMRRLGIGDAAGEDASTLIFVVGVCGILGGKVYYAAVIGDWHDLYSRAGIVWYGAFIGGFLALLWAIRYLKLPFARAFDATAPGLALGYAVGRIGCFLVGDDYGIPSDLPWAVKFEVGLPPTTAENLRYSFGVETPPELIDVDGFVAVHPTQLYETAAALVIWGISLWLLKRGVRPGNLFCTVVVLLGCERFLVELVRAKDDRYFGDFTLAQVISASIVVLALIATLRNRSRGAGGGA
ncbi:MAG: prolipoprotein diacylglyceryl transferase [bacterium]|nr:prolipoprotein diacylglyceryl transferase [bacterium]